MFDKLRQRIVDKLAPSALPTPGHISPEIGSTGLRISQGVIEEPALKALRMHHRRFEAFREMRYDDTVASVLHAIEMMMRRVPWEVVLADETPDSVEAAEFLDSCIEDMSHSWSAFISEVLWMLTDGFHVNEIVYKLRIGPDEADSSRRSKFADRRIGWRKLATRAAETIERWTTDEEGGITGVVQRNPNTNELIVIPIEQLLLFVTTHHKNNPEGRSILEGAYTAWYHKKHIREIEAIGIERDLVGYPIVRVPIELFTDTQKADKLASWQQIARDIKRDELEGLLVPSVLLPDSNEPAYSVELVKSPGGKQSDTSEVIRRENQAMAGVVLADWIQLGHDKVGSRALSTDKTSIFEASLDGWMTSIAEVMNRHAVPRLFAINAWRPAAGLPTMIPGSVSREDLQKFTGSLRDLSQAGMPLFPDDNLENHVRSKMRLPEKIETELEA